MTDKKEYENLEREALLSILLETEKLANVGSWEWDIQSDRVYWSEELFRIFGLDPSKGAPSYTDHPKIFTSESMQRLDAAVRDCINQGTPYEIESQIIRPNGEIRHCIGRGQAQRDENGKVFRLFGSHQDITERIKMETALLESEEKYRLLFENADDAIFVADSETGMLLDVNESAEALTGYKRNELIGKLKTFIHPLEKSDYYNQAFIKSARDKDSKFKEMVVRTKNGNDIPVEISSGGTFRGKNRSFHVGFFRDISGRKKMYDSLVKSESLFRGLYDHMTSGSGIYQVIGDGSKGSDYIVKNFNRKSLEIEEKTLDQVVGKSLFDLRPNIDDYGLIPVMKKVWETGEPAYFPIKIYQDDIFSNYYENYIFRIPSGEVVTIYNDVTDQKNAEKALMESEERLALAMEFADDGLFDWNLETNSIYYSPVWKKLLGYGDDEIKNEFSEWERLTRPEDVKASWRMLNELLDGKRNRFEMEFQMRHKDGHWVDILSRANAIFDKAGKGVRVIGTHVDITERKSMEEALRKSEEKFSKFFFSSPTWLAFTRLSDGRVLEINTAFEKITGFCRDEIIGRNSLEIGLWRETEKREMLMEEAREKGGFQEQEVIFFTKEDIQIPALWSAVVVEMEGEDYLLSTVMDISELRQAEQEKESLLKELQQAHKMEAIGTLAGGIAHEFNNVLSIIMGNAELALDDVPDWNPAKESLKEICKASFRAKEVVRQILSFARKTMTALKPLEIDTIVKESLKLMRASIPAMVDIQTDIPARPSMILGDPTELHQIMINLCTNAAYAMRESRGVLGVGISEVTLDKETASRYEDLSQGDFVKLTVRDSGEGIAPDILEKVFEPYFTTKEFGAGSGMGLSVVYGLVKKCKGAISIKSTMGAGTTVEVLFPKIEEAAPVSNREEAEMPQGNERILLVDDDPSIVTMIRQMLERIGYTVSSMTDSTAALDRFKSSPDNFDLVITDMSMPKMSGDQLAAELMKIREDIPILLCTGHSDTIDEKKAKRLGIKGFVMKPLNRSKLARAVREALGDR